MNKLLDYFQPLNFINLVYFALFVFFFDVLGSFIKKIFINDKKINSETRPMNWLIGLGFFVFVWFILIFFIVPTRNNLLISIVLIFLISMKDYFKNKEYLALLPFFKPLTSPIILVLPFLPLVFVKASLPPYVWDEMAYHFISPYTLIYHLGSYWTYNGGLYQNVPRLMDTLYILSFSLTNTYSVVRLLQFSILVTSLFCSFLFTKKLIGFLPAILFLLIFLSLPLQLPINSTIGYVDIPALSFLFLGFIFGIVYIFSKVSNYLILSSVFWAMAIGTKYTALLGLTVFMLSFLIVFWFRNRSFQSLFSRNLLFKAGISFIVFGGYWYLKNFVIYGNPVYPFFFPCWGKYAVDCVRGSSFFGNWTMPVNFHTLYPIIKELLPQNLFLRIMLLVSPLIILFFGNRKSKLILLLLAISFVVELFILKYFSGFYIRYQQHMQLFLIFVVVLACVGKFRSLLGKQIQFTVICLLFATSLVCYVYNLIYQYSPASLLSKEVRYATGRTDIYGWIRAELPDISEAIVWCGNARETPVALARYDPDMIWYNANGLMYAYFTSCYYANPNLSPNDWNNFSAVARDRKLKFWINTVNPCIPGNEVKLKGELEDVSLTPGDLSQMLQMRRLNNAIVCNSSRVAASIYHFDYQKLK